MSAHPHYSFLLPPPNLIPPSPTYPPLATIFSASTSSNQRAGASAISNRPNDSTINNRPNDSLRHQQQVSSTSCHQPQFSPFSNHYRCSPSFCYCGQPFFLPHSAISLIQMINSYNCGGSNPRFTCSTPFNGSRSSRQLCYYGQVLETKTAWTEKNYGRKFLGCSNFNKKGSEYCRFFQWTDKVNIPKEYIVKMKRLEEGIKLYRMRKERVVTKYKCCVALLVAYWVLFLFLYVGSC